MFLYCRLLILDLYFGIRLERFSIHDNNGGYQDTQLRHGLATGPLQAQVAQADFAEWQELESMGMGRQGIMQQSQPLGGEDGLYDLAVTYVGHSPLCSPLPMRWV